MGQHPLQSEPQLLLRVIKLSGRKRLTPCHHGIRTHEQGATLGNFSEPIPVEVRVTCAFLADHDHAKKGQVQGMCRLCPEMTGEAGEQREVTFAHHIQSR